MSLSWFPLYHGDYLRDTRSLSVSEHGCYLLLIMEFFSKGPLPDNIDRLCLIAAGASPETVRFILTTYWELVDGKWTNRKAAKVLEKQLEEHTRNVESGRRGALIRWAKDDSPPISPPISPANGNQNHNQTKPKRGGAFTPPTVAEVREYARHSGYAIDADKFVAFYEAKGWMIGKNRMKSWQHAVQNWWRNDSANHGKKPGKKEPML